MTAFLVVVGVLFVLGGGFMVWALARMSAMQDRRDLGMHSEEWDYLQAYLGRDGEGANDERE